MSTLHTTSSPHPRGKSPVPPVSLPDDSAKPRVIAEMTSRVATDRSTEPEMKWRMIAEAAYYCAEKRGFGPGHELDDWFQAATRINASTCG